MIHKSKCKCFSENGLWMSFPIDWTWITFYCLSCFFKQQQFPKKLPMSQSVPQIYSQVKEFIYASLKFSESLHRRWAEPKTPMNPHQQTISFGCRITLVSKTTKRKTSRNRICHFVSMACEAVIVTWPSPWEALIYGSELSLKPAPSPPPPAISSANICSL